MKYLVESVEILSLKEMNNRQFNLAFGPELARHTSEYYKVFDDIFPDKWASRLVEGSLENLLNFSVTFDGDSKSRPAFGNIISPNSVLTNLDFDLDINDESIRPQRHLKSRSSLTMTENHRSHLCLSMQVNCEE
jgi:hypothetical protein